MALFKAQRLKKTDGGLRVLGCDQGIKARDFRVFFSLNTAQYGRQPGGRLSAIRGLQIP
jgi:hypothetical protein